MNAQLIKSGRGLQQFKVLIQNSTYFPDIGVSVEKDSIVLI